MDIFILDPYFILMTFISLFVDHSVVRFRRTGESARSEDEGENQEQGVGIGAEQANMEPVALADEAPVPREFADPTDGTAWQRTSLLFHNHSS